MKDRPPIELALPLPWLLAIRYLRGSRRDASLRFLALLAAIGIALGVAALILVLAGVSGLQHFLRTDVLSRTPHLEIELPPETADAEVERLLATLRGQEGVTGGRQLIRGRGWLLVAGGTIEVQVVGFDGGLPEFFPRDASQMAEDTGQGLYIGQDLAARYGLEVGDLLDVASPRPTLTPFGPQPRIHGLRIAGLFSKGATEERGHRIGVPLALAERLFGARQRRIELQTVDLDRALELGASLSSSLPPGSRVATWRDLNRGLFFALKLERVVMFIAVLLIVPVAAMALITVLALLISSKRGEIGMLEAMGATPGAIERAFLALGSLLAAAGLAAGFAVGMGGAWLLDRFALLRPPDDAFFIDHIPFRLEAEDLLMVAAATAVFTVAAAWYAARRAAALGTLEALRA